jgi:hypothetical protein
MHEARRKAWETRRRRYGPAGHAGVHVTYQRRRTLVDPLGRRALALVVKLHLEEVLSEGQCCKALDMDRLDFRRIVDELT